MRLNVPLRSPCWAACILRYMKSLSPFRRNAEGNGFPPGGTLLVEISTFQYPIMIHLERNSRNDTALSLSQQLAVSKREMTEFRELGRLDWVVWNLGGRRETPPLFRKPTISAHTCMRVYRWPRIYIYIVLLKFLHGICGAQSRPIHIPLLLSRYNNADVW